MKYPNLPIVVAVVLAAASAAIAVLAVGTADASTPVASLVGAVLLAVLPALVAVAVLVGAYGRALARRAVLDADGTAHPVTEPTDHRGDPMTAPSPLPRSVRSARRAVTVATVLVVAAVGVAFAVGVVQAVTGDATRTAGGNFVALVLAVLAVGVVVNALFDATDRLRELEPAEGPTDARDGAA